MTPEGWSCEPLSNLGTLIKARGGTKKDQASAGVPVVRYGELYTRHGELIRRFYSFVPEHKASAYTPLRFGDILFAGSGETLDDIGRASAFLGPEPAHAGGDLILLRPSRDLDTAFLGYATNGPEARAQKRRLGQGSSVFHIHAEKLAKLTLRLPPLGEQRKIAAILSSVDDAIEATQAVIDQLQVVKKAMMAELLTRGLPGRHTRFKMTEIGEIPEEWEVVRLDEAVERTLVGHVGSISADYRSGGVPFLTTANVGALSILRAGMKFITREAHARLGKSALRAGDVIMSRHVQDAITCAVVPEDLDDSNCGNITIIRPGARINPVFLAALISASTRTSTLLSRSAGSAYAVINIGAMKSWPIAVPSKGEQAEIEAIIRRALDRECIEQEFLESLGEVKSALMSVLLTGEVRVKPDDGAPA